MSAIPAVRRGALVIGLGAALVIAATWAVVAAVSERDLEVQLASLRKDNDNLALALEEHTTRTLKSVDQVLQFVAFEYLDQDSKFDLREMAKAGLIDHDLLNFAVVVDPSGRIVAASGPVAVQSVAERDLFRFHRERDDGRLLISRSLAVGLLTGKPSMPISRRISRPDGSFAGIVVASINPEYFASYYGKVSLGENGIVLLVGLDGYTRTRRTGNARSSDEDMRDSSLLKAQKSAPNGSIVSAGRFDGVHRLMSYRTAAEYPLVVSVGQSIDEALAPVYARRRYAFAAATAITLIATALAAVLMLGLARRERARREAQRSEARFRATFDQARVGMAHLDLQGRFLKVNDALCAIVGYSREEALGQQFTAFKFAEDRAGSERIREQLLASGESGNFEVRYRHRGGTPLWLSVSVSLVRDADGRPEYFAALVQDITAGKEAQERIHHQATHDLLTDLPNRALFHDRLGQAMSAAQRRRGSGALLFLDLDRFKQVNDMLGHAAGDALLREVARRLAAAVRASDTAARIGGDEFAVVLAEITRAEDAALVAGKILEAMASPMYYDGRELAITVSIGIAPFPAEGGAIDALVRRADEAMFEAKQAGRNTFRVYSAAGASLIEAVA